MSKSIVSSLVEEWQGLTKRFNPKGPWRIRPYVASYLTKCLTCGQPVDILIQWCVTKMLEERKILQGGQIILTSDERSFFYEDLKKIIEGLKKWGLRVNIYVTFNLSNFESGRPSTETTVKYKKMIREAIQLPDIIFMDDAEMWDKNFDINTIKTKDLPEIKEKSVEFVINQLKRFFSQFKNDYKEEDFKQLALRKIAIEAEEGRVLVEKVFPDGFLLVPIEDPERYDFFNLYVPDFKDRLVPAVPRYPWRYKELY